MSVLVGTSSRYPFLSSAPDLESSHDCDGDAIHATEFLLGGS
jgi:hypothetical protein